MTFDAKSLRALLPPCTKPKPTLERLDLAGGKYTVINDNGRLSVLRYGGPWRDQDLVGDDLVYSLFVELQEARARITYLENNDRPYRSNY